MLKGWLGFCVGTAIYGIGKASLGFSVDVHELTAGPYWVGVTLLAIRYGLFSAASNGGR